MYLLRKKKTLTNTYISLNRYHLNFNDTFSLNNNCRENFTPNLFDVFKNNLYVFKIQKYN